MTDLSSSPATSKNQTDKSTRSGSGGRDDPAGRGRTTIADSVVEKIAAAAARDSVGVHSLGSGMARTLGSVRDRVPVGRPGASRGVSVEVGERQAAVDLDLVVDYGYPIADVATGVRTDVISAVERMTGLEVVEVNLAVGDVHLPDEEDDTPQSESRVT
ncbi:Asp23/Gls24 family envelope stress response protein [Streptomyces sp. NPDC088788]|uniref:Asp23/Gls24 family envelope stress response protein n=1 Tax=Streptomyces sp. NPDC088788 TaxID=3365898 RepID=UPI00380764D7